MRIIDVFRLSARMFKTRSLRTFLTILGISVGIGAILFLVSLGYGLQNILLEKIATSEALLSLDVVSSETGLLPLTRGELDKISKIPEVEKVSPLASFTGKATLGKFSGEILINAVDSDYFGLAGIQPKMGELFGSEDRDKILLSESTIQLFNIAGPKEALGKNTALTIFMPQEQDTLEIKEIEKKYQVSGIMEDEGISYGFIPLSSLADVNIAFYSQVKVKVSNDKYIESVRESIIDLGFLVFALSDTVEQANKIFRFIQIALAVFGIVALIVSAIGMFNTMTIALLERTQEIGIMKALGAANQDIWRLFLTESVIMGFSGGIGGFIIGFTGAEVFNWILNILSRALGGASLDLFYRPLWFILTIIIFAAAVGFLTGLWPARRAAKLKTLEALRYK